MDKWRTAPPIDYIHCKLMWGRETLYKEFLNCTDTSEGSPRNPADQGSMHVPRQHPPEGLIRETNTGQEFTQSFQGLCPIPPVARREARTVGAVICSVTNPPGDT